MDNSNLATNKYNDYSNKELKDYLKAPSHSWRGRARCFALFDKGLKPKNISPRRAKVKRKSLYVYFYQWKLIRTRQRLEWQKKRQEAEARARGPMKPVITISYGTPRLSKRSDL